MFPLETIEVASETIKDAAKTKAGFTTLIVSEGNISGARRVLKVNEHFAQGARPQ